MKTRIITAVVALPLLVVLLLIAPKIFTAVVAGLVAAIAAYELLQGTGLVKNLRLCLYGMATAFWCVLWCGLHISYGWLLLGIMAFWVALFAEMMISQMKLPFESVAVCFCGGVLLPLMLGSLVRMHSGDLGRFLVLMPLIIAFMSDSGAYFVGIYLGKHKLAPTISPKKTIEGAIGGVLGAVSGMLIYCMIMGVFFKLNVNYGFAAIYGILGSAAGVFGDLCFSMIKRQTGIKDYGKIIPGHGGILDRLDSILIVAPLTEILLLLLPVVV